MPQRISDPKHWQARADEARAMADRLTDPEEKRIILEIARAYAQLVQIAEARAIDKGGRED